MATTKNAGVHTVFIPRDPSEPDSNQLEICINGENTIIRRGESVQVPDNIYELLVFKGLAM